MEEQLTTARPKSILPSINVTPLIDVLLVLLIIFMVISPLRPTRFKALVPSPPREDERVMPNPLTIVVTVERDLKLRLNQGEALGTVNDMGQLSAELARTFVARKEAKIYRAGFESGAGRAADEGLERTVFIKAPRSVAYGDVAKVIDGVKGAGAAPVGLQIDDLAQ